MISISGYFSFVSTAGIALAVVGKAAAPIARVSRLYYKMNSIAITVPFLESNRTHENMESFTDKTYLKTN